MSSRLKAPPQLVGLAKRIFHSPTLREALNKACVDEDVKVKTLVRVVATRWNSFVEAVIRALYLKPALNNLLRQTKWSKKGKDGLGDYKLSEREWALLTELQHVLEVGSSCCAITRVPHLCFS